MSVKYIFIILYTIIYTVHCGELVSIRSAVRGSERRVVFDITEKAQYNIEKGTNSLKLTISNSVLSKNFKQANFSSNLIDNIKVAEQSGNILATFRLSNKTDYRLFELNEDNYYKIVIDFFFNNSKEVVPVPLEKKEVIKPDQAGKIDPKTIDTNVINISNLEKLYSENKYREFISKAMTLKNRTGSTSFDDKLLNSMIELVKQGDNQFAPEALNLFKSKIENEPKTNSDKSILAMLYVANDRADLAEELYVSIIETSKEKSSEIDNKIVFLPEVVNEPTIGKGLLGTDISFRTLVLYASILIFFLVTLLVLIRRNSSRKRIMDELNREFTDSEADNEEQRLKRSLIDGINDMDRSIEDEGTTSGIDENVKDKIFELYDNGYTNREIAETLAVSIDTVSFVIRSKGGIDNAMKADIKEVEITYNDISGLIPDVRRLYNDGFNSNQIATRLKAKQEDVNQALSMITNEVKGKYEDEEDKSELIKKLASEGKSKKEISEKLGIGLDEVEFAASLFDIEFSESQLKDSSYDIKGVSSELDFETDEHELINDDINQDELPVKSESFEEESNQDLSMDHNEYDDDKQVSSPLKPTEVEEDLELNETLQESFEEESVSDDIIDIEESNIEEKVENSSNSLEQKIEEEEIEANKIFDSIPDDDQEITVEMDSPLNDALETYNNVSKVQFSEEIDSPELVFSDPDIDDHDIEQLRQNIQTRFSDIFDYEGDMLSGKSKLTEKMDIPIIEENVEEPAIDLSVDENLESIENIEDSSQETSEIVNQNDIDALFNANNKNETANPVKKENAKVNQADIDALFNQNNKKAEEPKKAETKKVNQNDIDELFNANKKTENVKPVKNENTKVNQADIDALFNQNNKKAEEPKK
ncbi:MAG: hypothetical protein JXR48_07955, partial [Candidatus Delongbacteria bacterium]|nr:hypothetical protein [Candidatus Delongbacteria bacterium]MBN2834886.1 hypothetical protein [Candidatus Delongbacteria bacterium]